jgi:hypothetical protein
MDPELARFPHRVRLHWRDIDNAIQLLRTKGEGKFHATLQGKFPLLECERAGDASALTSAFSTARLVDPNAA